MSLTVTESNLLRKEVLTALKKEKARQKREQYKKEPGRAPTHYENFWSNVSAIKIVNAPSKEIADAMVNGIKKVST